MATIQTNCVRALDSTGDWTFGNSSAGYLQGNAAISQQVPCNVKMILGECFWATNFGINWFGFLSSAQPQALSLAIQTVILNSVNVTGINSSAWSLNPVTREFETQPWDISTIFSQTLPVSVTSPITN
jgi:hypothetical protein